ncbi:MAG: LysM peptidoglycan-binding domain-containing protein [Microbacter sp.]
MKKSVPLIVSCVITFILFFSATAQQINYPMIQENGHRYFLYTVQPQEGLFAIARKFNISQADILTANPTITEAIQAGQQIKIPIEPQTTEYRKHIVTKKQTLYSIAYLYGTTVDAIVALNPDAANGIKDGEVLLIPPVIPKEITSAPTNINPEPKTAPVKPHSIKTLSRKTTYILHKVQPGETLYSLSRRYQVTVDAIQQANPTMNGLKADTEIKIPTNEMNATNAKVLMSTIPQQTVEKAFQEKTNITAMKTKKNLKIGILLPFSLDGQNTDGTIDKFVNFYQGALLALYNAKEEGISAEVFTYDVEKNNDNLLPLLNKESPLWHVDFIIGPAYAGQVQTIASFAKAHKIYTIIPFSSQVEDIASNPYLIQFNPPLWWQCEASASLFAQQFSRQNIVIANIASVQDPSNTGAMFVQCVEKKLSQAHIPYRTISLPNQMNALQSMINPNQPTIVVIGDDNIDDVVPYLRTLGTMALKYNNLSVFGFPDWEPEQGIFPRLYFTSLFYINNQKQLADYDQSFYHWFHTQPTFTNDMRFDLLGYDLTSYLINVWTSSPISNSEKRFSVFDTQTIQSQFRFQKTVPNGGWINKEMKLLYYKTSQGITEIHPSGTKQFTTSSSK